MAFAVSAEARRKAEESGQARGNGSWPIRNKADLKNAIQAIGRAKPSERTAVKRWIIKRARELDAIDLLPESWNAKESGESVTLALDDWLTQDFNWVEERAGLLQTFNWVEEAGGLPPYIKRIAKHLKSKGMAESHAIATAVNVVKKMCATGDVNWPGKQDVNAGSRAEACAAVARWEAMKASHAAESLTAAGEPDTVDDLLARYEEEMAALAPETLSELESEPVQPAPEPAPEPEPALQAAATPQEEDPMPRLSLTDEGRPFLTASAIPVKPPAEWLEDPKLAAPTPLTITEDGRVFGHLATWGVCHIAHNDQCVTAPHSATNYAYFRTGALLTRDGGEVPVGQITLDTTHAGPKMTHMAAANHYENTGKAVADVVAGEDRHGIWVAGALRPSATEDQVRALRAAPLSGDWRRVGGNLELVAALSVIVPDFPVPRPTGLVASGAVQSLVASGIVAPSVVRESRTVEEAALAREVQEMLSPQDIAYLRTLIDREREVLADTAAEEDCGCDGTDDDAPQLGDRVIALANQRRVAKLAERVKQLRATATPQTTYACNCRKKTRPYGPASQTAAATTNTTTVPPKGRTQTFTYIAPTGVRTRYGSMLEAKAAAKRGGGKVQAA